MSRCSIAAVDPVMASNQHTPVSPLSDELVKSSKHALDPIDRISEVLFGVIMVLTFTGSLSVADAGHSEVRTMLVGALGCNLAWGIIDAVLYLMGCLAERGRHIAMLRDLSAASDAQASRQIIAVELPPSIASVLQPGELDAIRERLAKLPAPPAFARLSWGDFRGAGGVFLLVFLSTLPIVLPFVILKNIYTALRVSNLIAIMILFSAGYMFGRITGRPPLRVGFSVVLLGLVLVAITMVLGG